MDAPLRSQKHWTRQLDVLLARRRPQQRQQVRGEARLLRRLPQARDQRSMDEDGLDAARGGQQGHQVDRLPEIDLGPGQACESGPGPAVRWHQAQVHVSAGLVRLVGP
jgi:hypothetical protein